MANNYLFAICGEAGSGKSTGLDSIKNQKRWLYLNCETNKPLPFMHSFQEKTITNPLELKKWLIKGIASEKIDGIIIDTLTGWLSMLEVQCNRKFDGYEVWNEYKKQILAIFQDCMVQCNKPVFFLSHTKQTTDMRGRATIQIPVQGSLKDLKLENFFTNILYADVLTADDVEDYKNPYLYPDEDDEETFYVYQTRKCANGMGANVRSTKGLWSKDETYIANNCQTIIDKMTALIAANEVTKEDISND